MCPISLGMHASIYHQYTIFSAKSVKHEHSDRYALPYPGDRAQQRVSRRREDGTQNPDEFHSEQKDCLKLRVSVVAQASINLFLQFQAGQCLPP